jgi:hypothetical protein
MPTSKMQKPQKLGGPKRQWPASATGEESCHSKQRVSHIGYINTYNNTGTIFYITFSPSPTKVTMEKYLMPPPPPSKNIHDFQTQFK